MTPPDIVPDVDEATLRDLYGTDADTVIAFKRFLNLAGPVRPIQLPPHWYRYATGELDSAQVIAIDDSVKEITDGR